jgi:hypothetical protein
MLAFYLFAIATSKMGMPVRCRHSECETTRESRRVVSTFRAVANQSHPHPTLGLLSFRRCSFKIRSGHRRASVPLSSMP